MDIYNQDAYMRFRNTRMEVRDGILVMSYKLKMTVLPEQDAAVPIMPISDNEAVVLGLGRGMNETIYIDNVDGREILHFSGYTARWTSYDNGRDIYQSTTLAAGNKGVSHIN